MEDAGAVLDRAAVRRTGRRALGAGRLVAECRSAPGRAGLFGLEGLMKKGSSG